MSLATDISDAIVTLINGASFSRSVVASRTYRPAAGFDTLVGARILVTPAEEASTVAQTRALDAVSITIHVGIQAKITAAPGEDTEEIDGWQSYADEVKFFINRLETSTEPKFSVVSTQRKPLWAPEHLEPSRVLTTVIAVTIKTAWRPD